MKINGKKKEIQVNIEILTWLDILMKELHFEVSIEILNILAHDYRNEIYNND